MNVTIKTAAPDALSIIKNMFTAYFYDMSQYDDGLIINGYGLPHWAAFGLPGPATHEKCVAMNWWIRDRCEALIIRADGNPAGFAFVCADRSHIPPEVDFELLDFYIAPKYRRLGIGKQAAQMIFDGRRGRWQLFELARNLPALAFWHGFLKEYTGGVYENLDEGTQQRFANSLPANPA